MFHLLHRATIMQHETSNVGKGNVEAVSVAIPAVMRAGGDGKGLRILLQSRVSQNQCLVAEINFEIRVILKTSSTSCESYHPLNTRRPLMFEQSSST